MSTYILRMINFNMMDSESTVRAVLNCPTVDKIVFPATIDMWPDSLRVSRPEEFDFAAVTDVLYRNSSLPRQVSFVFNSDTGIRLTVMMSEGTDRWSNVVNLSFTHEHLSQSLITFADIKLLFFELIPAFQAEHALIYERNDEYKEPKGPPKIFTGPNRKTISSQIGWFTYFGPELVDFMGRKRFDKLKTCAEKYDLHGGIMIVLQHEPFSNSNPQHTKRAEKAEAELALHKLPGPRR